MPVLRWGVLSTANFGRTSLPAMQQSPTNEIVAVASRSLSSAEAFAQELGIPRALASYEALLADPAIDAVYLPLPNHLHVEWAKRALEAGKHVLCEKPIALNAADAQELLAFAQQFPQRKIAEAFMYRFHPQWQQAKEWTQKGYIGDLRAVQSWFSYYNADPQNIRNQATMGGGGLLDIGCYCVSLSRWLFGAEPDRVVALHDQDPRFATDRLASGMLDFGSGRQATFTCSTQVAPFQRVQILGTTGRIEIEVPFNAIPDQRARLTLFAGSHNERGRFVSAEPQVVEINICNQYTLQAEAFAQAVFEDKPVPFGLDDAVANMRVLDALQNSAQSDTWIQL
jgi:predicted dehydrogenase